MVIAFRMASRGRKPCKNLQIVVALSGQLLGTVRESGATK